MNANGKTKVKMCGMMRPEDIMTVNEIKPDYIGFIFAANRRRTVSAETAATLRNAMDAQIKAVGVFLDQDMTFVAETAKTCNLDLIQLHGSEDNDYIRKLKELTGKPVIKAFVVKDESTIEKANASCADMILLDSGAGSGQTFAWQLLGKVQRPYFLAGGLNPENAKEAIQTIHPYALDVSSGIETNGAKDPAKMKRFMQEVTESNKEETP